VDRTGFASLWEGDSAPPGRLAQAAPNPIGASGAPSVGTEKAEEPSDNSTALGPLPVDPSLIQRIRVAGALVNEAPLRVGNLDVLAPIADKLDGLGASASQVSLRNIPGNANTPTGEQFFQINLFNRPPIVMAVGKAVAYVNQIAQPRSSWATKSGCRCIRWLR